MISFVPSLARAVFRSRLTARVLLTSSMPALGLAAGLFAPLAAQAQQPPRAAFGSMLAMQNGQITLPDGTKSQWTGANRPTIGTDTDGRPLMSIQQTQAKALLDWEDFRLQAGEVLEFQQQRSDWIAVNRVHGAQAAEIHGEIRATGRVFVLNDNGVLVGDDAVINTRQLVTGTGVSDVNVVGNTTTITQSGPRSILEWRGDLTQAAGDVLRIQQLKNDWIQMNRFVGGVAHLNGSIQADGHLYLVAPEGLEINGHIKAQQVLASQLNLNDYQFGIGLLAVPPISNARQVPQLSNFYQPEGYWSGLPAYVDMPVPVDENDALRYNLTIGKGATIETASLGKIMLFGNNVTNRGMLHAVDGQIVMGAGEHAWLGMGDKGQITATVGPYAPYAVRYVDFPYIWGAIPGEPVPPEERYAHWLQYQVDRVRKVGFRVINEGEITSERGNIDVRGFDLRQMGIMAATSTAVTKGAIDFSAFMFQQDYEYPGPVLAGNGSIVFGPKSVTTILPDMLSKDTVALSVGPQSVGTISLRGRTVHMQDDALIYLPSGLFRMLLDAGSHVQNFGGNKGDGANQDNEDGTRFLMESGAVVDLSGWNDVLLPMESNTVSGRLFISQLKDSPLQRNGALYRQLVEIDRRYGTHVADWSAFDNLTQATLPQLLLNGGRFEADVGNDFIMKKGSVIDVSGGAITYAAGFVNTTLLQTADGRVIDIRNADPDEIYVGLANQYVVQDAKWGQSKAYYVPLMSSRQGRYEESYQHGGAGGAIEILAPDSVFQGTVLGDVTVGKYQRGAPPKGGTFSLNAHAGGTEGEYRNNKTLIEKIERLLGDGFTMDSSLSDLDETLFGEEIEAGEYATANQRFDNGALFSEGFFNRSTMGAYAVEQRLYEGDPLEGPANLVEAGVSLNLANGASFTLDLADDLVFLGDFRSQGGAFSVSSGRGVAFSADTTIDTRGGWFSDYEYLDNVPIVGVPRINGGSVTIAAGDGYGSQFGFPSTLGLVMPEGMTINTGGGAWVDRTGAIKLGKGGDITINSTVTVENPLELDAELSALGLGGNGALSLGLKWDDILIADEDGETEEGRRTQRFGTDFFRDAGFSAIKLTGRAFTIAPGTQIEASASTMTLVQDVDGRSPFYAPTGTDMSLLTQVGPVPVGLRPAALRNGMALTFAATQDTLPNGTNGDTNPFQMGAGSSVSVEAGGAISIGSFGETDILGDLSAAAGKISLSGASVHIGGDSSLSAIGAVRTLSEIRSPDGRILREGEVLPGGEIAIVANAVAIDKGAVLDVSGASAVFDVADSLNGAGVVVRTPRTIASAGGAISIMGASLDINDATYLAKAGGASARGGAFNLTFMAETGGGNPNLPTGEAVAEGFGFLNYYGLMYLDGTPVDDIYGADLSQVDFANTFGMAFDFPPGYTIATGDDLASLFQAYADAAQGTLPALIIGDNLPTDTGPIAGPDLPEVPQGLRDLLTFGVGYQIPEAGEPAVSARFSPGQLEKGGFSSVSFSSPSVIRFSGDTHLGAQRADGSFTFDTISLSSAAIIGSETANVVLSANKINLQSDGVSANLGALLANEGLEATPAGSQITLNAGSDLILTGGEFYGFETVSLLSQGNLSGHGVVHTPGALRLQADQIYATTRYLGAVKPLNGLADLTFDSELSIDVLAAAAGPASPAPYEAANTLTLRAPRIRQGGVLRSPLGTINLIAENDGTVGSGVLTLLPGSLTSASADGRIIPFGYTANGDTFLGPNGQELSTLPLKTVNLNGDTLDLQSGAVIDVSGGGDIFAYEFVSGVGGTYDWLTGYRDEDYNWVADASEIFAVVPSFDADPSKPNAGPQIYLSGGSGLAAGYYTLLPARYALLPGAFRVTANHNKGDFANMPLGTVKSLNDGSSIQAGYQLEAGTTYKDQRTTGFMVMPGATLRTRSQYVETLANTFFQSEAYLRRALRSNLPLGAPPRTPQDGGSVVLSAVKGINLDATLKSAGDPNSKTARGGFADINAPRIAIVSASTMDDGVYGDDYLLLDAEQLSQFGAESLLIGGVRRQGAAGVEVVVSADTVVVDNAGSVLYGPEVLFAATNDVMVKGGAAIEVRGQIGGSSGDLTLAPGFGRLVDDKGTSQTWDDVFVHDPMDQGALLRASSDGLVGVLRDAAAVDRLNALLADPVALEALNDQRVALGYAPIVPGGRVTVDEGARITGARSVVLDATQDTRLSAGATLETAQLSASASRISFGDVDPATSGLVFTGGSLGALGRVDTLVLKSYSTIDFHGPVDLAASGSLVLDGRQIRSQGAGGAVNISGDKLQLTNTSGLTSTASAGTGRLSLTADEVSIGTGVVALDGFGAVSIEGRERVIGRGTGGLVMPGDLDIRAGSLTAESGANLTLDAAGAVRIAALTPPAGTTPFKTLGATINIIGASVDQAGTLDLAAGTVGLRARSGDVVLRAGSLIDVTGDVATIFDRSTPADAGSVNLTADNGNVAVGSGATIDLSGAAQGGSAGTLRVSVPRGSLQLAGAIKATAATNSRGGSFELNAGTLEDFSGLGAVLNGAGFDYSRRFKIATGDVVLDGVTKVQNFSLAADGGSILVNGTIQTTGANGGSIRLSAAEDMTLAGGGKLIARGTGAGAGGTVILETAGANGGAINLAAGSLIDVSGQGQGGRTVRLRAPQIGGDVAIDGVNGQIVGARSVLAEAYRVYDDVETIDQGVIDQATIDADAFMGGAAAIQGRLGGGVRIVPGIEFRNDGDMALVTDWDLSGLRYGGNAGVLTLRAAGDLRFDANLSDGFSDATRDGALLDGDSWSYSLTAGADLNSADSSGVLAVGLLQPGKGSLRIGGIADVIDYYIRSGSTVRALYLRDPDTGVFIEELAFDTGLDAYIDPRTGQPIARDPVTGEFVEGDIYGYRELPYAEGNGSSAVPGNPAGVQIDTSDGYYIRTGTGSITTTAGRDIVFEQKASALYTAGVQSAAIPDFDAPTQMDPDGFEPIVAYYPENGGDIVLRAQNDIVGGDSDQFPGAWLWRLGEAEGTDDTFSPGTTGRPYEQSTWFVAYKNFRAGVGALGGGNVTISAGGDIANLSASIPTTGRVSGNRFVGDVAGRINTLGGGNLTVDAGGDILSGLYYVGEGQGTLTAGGAFRSGSDVWGLFSRPLDAFRYSDSHQPIHTLLFTSGGQFSLSSGGEMNIEAVLDPLSGVGSFENAAASTIWTFANRARAGYSYFQTYEPDAAVNLFSAGGDIKIWNNSRVVAARQIQGAFSDVDRAPLLIGKTDYGPVWGSGNENGAIHMSNQHYLWPSNLSAVAAAGDVIIQGGFTLFPSATGNLELLAGQNVFLDLVLDFADDPTAYIYRDPADYNFLTGTSRLLMSQSDPTLVPNPLDPAAIGDEVMQSGAVYEDVVYGNAGIDGYGFIPFSEMNAPDLHEDDHEPIRIYAGEGDIFMNRRGRGVTGSVNFPKQAWFFAGDDIYFPNFITQHNNPTDLSIYRAGDNIFFSKTSTLQVKGPGRLEIESGHDIYIPSQALGIQTGRIEFFDNQYDTTGEPWRPDERAADIGISTGYNQTPSYEAFEAAYLDPTKTADQADYLVEDLGGGRKGSSYLIDQVYERAGGPDQEFPTESREGLVNYVRRLQGLEPLEKKEDQLAYIDQAWAAWQMMRVDQKTAFFREVLFVELRTAGREANDPNSDRYQSANRGYDAIKTLYPGAEKSDDQALGEGESRWSGDFETYLSLVRSNGGGDIEFVSPGGAFRLANSLAGPSDPTRAGVITLEGGEINIFTHDSVVVNESRILTAKGGNVMIWSSYGDIAAGRGARTSITPPNYIYRLGQDAVLVREPGGLPSGAGIGTLATVPGTPPADVDLVAPNGIVDAGDGGIRVSGNFNVFAVQVLGTDNIEVGGVATGLPQPPATPPNSLDVDDAASKAADVNEAINDAVDQVRQNAGVASPSIIEVKVVGYGDDCRDENGRRECPPAPTASSGAARASASPAPARAQPVRTAQAPARTTSHRFDLPPQPLGEALRSLGRQTGVNLVYDSQTLSSSRTVSLRGEMTLEQALGRLLSEEAVTYERTGPGTVVVRPASK